jgi:signal transduction histidine kinase
VSTTAFAQQQTAHSWWQHWRPRISALYLLIALVLLLLSLAGHIRLWGEIGKTFGGFTWMVDPDSPDHAIIIITTPPQLPPFVLSADSLTSTTHIATVNSLKGSEGSERVYKHARPGDTITYTTQTEQTSTKINKIKIYTRPAATFTLDMWWQTFGLPFLAGIIWLAVGAILLTTAPEWTSGVEGITLLPPAMLLLLYSHWGNIQTAHTPDLVAQLLWIPSFALLGAAFIHLSLNYRPATMNKVRQPDWRIDGLPYAPLVALLLYEWLSVLFIGHVPLRLNLLLSLGYAVIGGVISLSIGITSLWRIAGLWLPGSQQSSLPIPRRIRHYISDLLTLWIGGVGLGFCFGVLPILLTGQALLPLPIFYVLAAVYPLILLYAIRSLRLIARLHATIDQREEALHEQRKMAQTLQMTNQELQQATDLLLHADAHLRSLLSQRIHDQPKQQALRIRSLLGHWQYKLRQEAERDAEGKVVAQPIIEALGKVRKISDELEDDLQGLQLLVEDAYQRRSLGLRLHLEKFIHEDLPVLHPESPLKIQTDLWALDALSPDLENTVQGERIAEAISYTVTQALLNIYNHSGATFAAVRTQYAHGLLTIHISDNGHGFIPDAIAPNKTSLFKARLKVRAANGQLEITSTPPAETGQPTPSFPGPHGTTVTLQIPIPAAMQADTHIQDLHPNNTV